MASIVSAACWPFVVIRCPVTIDARWMDGLEDGFRDTFARRERFVILTDTTRVSGLPGAIERRRLAEWAAKPEHLELQKTYCIGSAAILKNALVRGALQAVYWLYSPPAPQYVARDVDDAWKWCLGMLDKGGITLPMPARELRQSVDREIAIDV